MQPPAGPDDSAALESALLRQDREFHELLLFVAGATPNSARAIRNTRKMCAEHLADRHHLTIIDLYQQPALAAAEQVIAAPTLIRKLPLPSRRMVGTMADAQRLVLSLRPLPPSTAG